MSQSAWRNKKKDIIDGGLPASQILSLSLFIVLLAFFILLNGLSEFDERKTPDVMQSIQDSFGTTNIFAEAKLPPPVIIEDENRIPSIYEGSVYERLNALFKSQIPEFESSVDDKTGMITFEISLAKLEAAVSTAGQKNALTMHHSVQNLKRFFVPTLAAILDLENSGRYYRMDMLIGIGDNPATIQSQSPQTITDYAARADSIASQISEEGVPDYLIRTGLSSRNKNTVILFFYPEERPIITDGDER